LREVQDLHEEKMYQINMLKGMDIDKISDNVSVSGTEFHHGAGMISIPENLGYGPQALQYLTHLLKYQNRNNEKSDHNA
jgi:hypothetical protein